MLPPPTSRRDPLLHELATHLARLAQRLRAAVHEARGTAPLPDQQADDFAQAAVYGMVAAYSADPFQPLSPELTYAALRSLRPLLGECLDAVCGGEIGRTLPNLLKQAFAATDLDALRRMLGRCMLSPDFISVFYEHFLAAYEPSQRKAWGVYYTPQPIIRFLVRAVSDLLQSHFDLPAGLATGSRSAPLLVLDPACGTGSFLAGVLAQSGSSPPSRLLGFELLPVPCAIAQMQLRQLLAEKEPSPEPERTTKLGIYRTGSFAEMAALLREELTELRSPRGDQQPILIVLGNPPYRGRSVQREPWILQLLEDYRWVNGLPLGEKKVWLRNDYVQFLRFGQWAIEAAGRGILALVTDHSYLDSPTFRGVRHRFLQTFDEIAVLNLHGNSKRRERGPDGHKDENLFAIRQGVGLTLFLRGEPRRESCGVAYTELWGTRDRKAAHLEANRLPDLAWQFLHPAEPGFELVPIDRATEAEYVRGWPIKEVFPLGSSGVQTSRDRLVVAFTEAELVQQIRSFLAPGKTEAQLRAEFFPRRMMTRHRPGDTRQWRLGTARSALRSLPTWKRALIPYCYRPFDKRWLLYVDCMVDWPRHEVMRHLDRPNLALCVGRAGLVAAGGWDLVFCVDRICDHNLFYRGSSVDFPLYLHDLYDPPPLLIPSAPARRPNLALPFIAALTEALRLAFVADRPGDLRRTVGPEDVLHYAYAVLHAPSYRCRYAEFLKYDFPRLPLVADRAIFRALCRHGRALVEQHVWNQGEAPTPVVDDADPVVRHIRYTESTEADGRGQVWINDSQAFADMPAEVWQFQIGGYQVCHKWLKDRKGRRLTRADQEHYGQIVAVLAATLRHTRAIEQLVAQQGGWPLLAVARSAWGQHPGQLPGRTQQ